MASFPDHIGISYVFISVAETAYRHIATPWAILTRSATPAATDTSGLVAAPKSQKFEQGLDSHRVALCDVAHQPAPVQIWLLGAGQWRA